MLRLRGLGPSLALSSLLHAIPRSDFGCAGPQATLPEAPKIRAHKFPYSFPAKFFQAPEVLQIYPSRRKEPLRSRGKACSPACDLRAFSGAGGSRSRPWKNPLKRSILRLAGSRRWFSPTLFSPLFVVVRLVGILSIPNRNRWQVLRAGDAFGEEALFGSVRCLKAINILAVGSACIL